MIAALQCRCFHVLLREAFDLKDLSRQVCQTSGVTSHPAFHNGSIGGYRLQALCRHQEMKKAFQQLEEGMLPASLTA